MVLKEAPMVAYAYVGSLTWTDMTVQARMKILDFGGTSSTNCAGLIARFSGSGEAFYQVGLCAKGDVGAYKDGGLIDDVNGFKASGIVAGTWYDVKMKVAGAPGNVSITVWLNDAQLFAIKDTDTSTPVSAGFVAVGSKKSIGVEYDDFKVSTP
jgi:hypothetical protein